MFPSKALFNLFFLAFFAISVGAAHPLRRRSSCPAIHHNPSPSSSSLSSKPTSSSTSSSRTPSATAVTSSTAGSTGTGNKLPGGLLTDLFPVTGFRESWTTAPSSQQALPLDDSTFRPNHVLNTVVHTYTDAPDGTRAMKAHYPEGSYNFGHEPEGGFSFYAPGPASVDLTTAKEATFGYSVFFPEGFEFNLGGKLPGLYGGNTDEDSIGCSGGSRSAACFSARLMWRDAGKGEFYTYLPPYTEPQFAANKAVCDVAPLSDCNPVFGASVGRGSFRFALGAWTTISERVRLNDVGQANGELELFVNGQSVINVGGLILRDSDAGRIRGMQMQTFFGGSHPEFKSPKSQDTYFSDFSIAITETL